jgi:hypothetical protein
MHGGFKSISVPGGGQRKGQKGQAAKLVVIPRPDGLSRVTNKSGTPHSSVQSSRL